MGNTPVFGAEDRVEPDVNSLPAELQGKSAVEVAAYYQERERKARVNTSVQPPPKMPTNDEFWTDPAKNVGKGVDAHLASKGVLTKDSFFQLAEPLRENMIQMAEFLTAKKFDDWATYKAEIDNVMNTVEPWTRTQSGIWETTYYYVKGRVGVKPPSEPGKAPVVSVRGPEGGSPTPSNPNPAQPQLTPEQAYVADHMGLSAQQYLDADQNMKAGKFPLTMSNTKGR